MIVEQEKLVIKRSEWECHIDTPDVVIEQVNKEFLEILNTTHSPVWAQKRFYEFVDGYDQYGFRDSECNRVATDVINKYYNSNITRWDFLDITPWDSLTIV